MQKNPDTYCPWTYRALSLEMNEMRPCCRFQDEVRVTDDTVNFEYVSGGMEKIRNRLDSGERLSACSQCWQQEDLGHKSMRQQGIERWGYVENPDIEYLELTLDNTCNLRCLTCCSHLSTGWIKEEKKIFGKSINDEILIDEQILKDFDFSKLKTVKFLGGEPLMSSAITNISKKLIELPEIDLCLNTNATVLPNETLEKLFLSCQRLSINLSIDGIGDLNNFIRYNAEWDTIENNFKFFDSLIDRRGDKETKISTHSTINAYNANTFHEILNYFKEKFPRFEHSHNMLVKPEFMAIENLPLDYKEQLKEYATKHNFTEMFSFLDQPGKDLFNYFVNYHDKICSIRNIDFTNINPMLHQRIKEHKKVEADFEKIFLMKGGLGDSINV